MPQFPKVLVNLVQIPTEGRNGLLSSLDLGRMGRAIVLEGMHGLAQLAGEL